MNRVLVRSQRSAARDRESPAARALGLATLAAVCGVTILQGRGKAQRAENAGLRATAQPAPLSPESRRLHAVAALLAASVLVDSGIEHYRGSFSNPGMYAPLLAAGSTLLAGAAAAAGRPTRSHAFGHSRMYAAAVAVGVAGTAFHLYNVFRRPGGASWLNLFYAAPMGAPAALSLAGVFGLSAARIGNQGRHRHARLLGRPAGRVLAALSGLGLAGTAGEAALLHFRGAFQNPFMYAPVSVPPVAAASLLKAALSSRTSQSPRWQLSASSESSASSQPSASSQSSPSQRSRPSFGAARFWLALTALLGMAGVGFHAFGVSRAMGGWRNWKQNVIDGPPLPAPPSFSALALAGFAALSLLELEQHQGSR